MQAFVRVRSSFFGSHTLGNHPECDRDCGHVWNVEVEVFGDEEEERHQMPVDETRLLQDISTYAKELTGKDIDKMIKPSVSSPIGIAHYFYERMANKYEVTEVRVWINPEVGAILRAP